MDKLIITGNVGKGMGLCSGRHPRFGPEGTIKLQKPFFEKTGVPNISKVHNGTINLNIAPKKFKIHKPDYEVTCNWFKGYTETFWLVKAEIKTGEKLYPGYIYYPRPSEFKSEKLPGLSDNDVIEILCEKIQHLKIGDSVIVSVNKENLALI